MEFRAVPTVISKSSQAIRAIKLDPPEPELEPLVPVEPELNRTAYELFLENLISSLIH